MIQKESESRDEQGVTQPFYSMDTQLSTSRTFNLIFTFPSSFLYISSLRYFHCTRCAWKKILDYSKIIRVIINSGVKSTNLFPTIAS